MSNKRKKKTNEHLMTLTKTHAGKKTIGLGWLGKQITNIWKCFGNRLRRTFAANRSATESSAGKRYKGKEADVGERSQKRE